MTRFDYSLITIRPQQVVVPASDIIWSDFTTWAIYSWNEQCARRENQLCEYNNFELRG